MTRQFPSEIYVGQVVHLRFEAWGEPIESEVVHLDYTAGRVHVQPLGNCNKFAALPLAVTSLNGQYLHFDEGGFYFNEKPVWN